MKMYFKGGKGIEKPIDVNGIEIKEGSTLTFDWFDCENPIDDMRRKFTKMKDWTDKQISDRIHRPTFNVKKNKEGVFFGEGIEDPKHKHNGRLYLHDFRFKYTKVVNAIINITEDEREQAYLKHFRDDPQFRGRAYRLRDNYIFHKDEAYECIDYYLRTGTKP